MKKFYQQYFKDLPYSIRCAIYAKTLKWRGLYIDSPVGCTATTRLQIAVIEGNAAMVKALINAGANANTTIIANATALHYAVDVNNPNLKLNIIKCLIAKTDLTIANSDGQTPLHLAVETQNVEVINMLLAAGANPNLKDSQQKTSLHYAIDLLNIVIIELLIDNGADLKVTGGKVQQLPILSYALNSPLVDLRITNVDKVIQVLLNFGADPNAIMPPIGNTVLHETARRGRFSLVPILIQAKANPNQKNFQDKTPFDVTMDALSPYRAHKNFIETIKFLIAGGANPNLSRNPLLRVIDYKFDLLFDLLALGADLYTKTKTNHFPYDGVSILEYLKQNHGYYSKQEINSALNYYAKAIFAGKMSVFGLDTQTHILTFLYGGIVKKRHPNQMEYATNTYKPKLLAHG